MVQETVVRRLVESSGPVDAGDESRAVLRKLVRNWPTRAQVRRGSMHEDVAFDPSRPDFCVSLLPFKEHPRFLRFNEEELSATLSGAWLAYNHKTLDIETGIVLPLCTDVLAGKVAGLGDAVSKQTISETMVDESYHVLLTVNATGITREMRGLDIEVPPSALVRMTRACEEEYAEEWQRSLIRFAVAVVSEVFISDYLLQLASSEVVQPLHRLTVDAHRRDEAAHGVVFRHLARLVFPALSKTQREFFAAILPRPVRWFAAPDFGAWASIFQQLGIRDTEELISDCAGLYRGKLGGIDYSGVVSLARELGITDMSIGRDAFESEGLLV